MGKGFRHLRLVFTAVGALTGGVHAAGATIALKAVRINDSVIDPPQSVLTAAPGDTIVAEIRIFGWADELPTGVRSYQAMIDGARGAVSGDNGTVLPLGWSAPLIPQACESSDECDVGEICQFLVCVEPDHDPSAGAFIDSGRPDFILDGLTITEDVRTRFPDYRYFATASDGMALDPEYETYGGTLILVVSDFACGTFTFGFLQQDTFLGDEFNEPVFAATPPLYIDLGCPPLVQGSNPAHCAVDAGIPHDPADTEAVLGWDAIDIDFDLTAAGMACADFELSTAPIGVAPTCDGVETTGNSARIQLDTVIQPEKWTCFLHLDSNRRTCIGYLPGDADANLVTDADDVQALVNDLNGAVPPMELHRCDVDRSNECTPLDILSTIDLLNGADRFDVWYGATIPVECPMP